MQAFKPTNTKHLFQDIKGQAVLATTVLLTVLTSGALISQSNLHQHLAQAAETSLTALAQETPLLINATLHRVESTFKNTLNSLSETRGFLMQTGLASHQVKAVPHPAAALHLNVKFQQVTAATTTSAQESSRGLELADLSTTDLSAIRSPFANRVKSTTTANIRNTKAFKNKVATLTEINQFFAHKHENYSFVEHKYFLANTQKRLPKFQHLFKQAAQKYQLDWRLVAAIAYQESVWDPEAVSPTGVRGMMMLTKVTAAEMGVKDRTNVTESIFGGAAYFKKLLDRLPAEITGPDRELMALASYNMGYGHLIAARDLTAQQGADNTLWKEVKKRLPLLQQSQYYKASPYGYAHGARQAVHYVAEIQKHLDMLLMLTEKNTIVKGQTTLAAISGFELARH